MVLDFLAVDNFDSTRKIVKKNLGENSGKCWGVVKIEFLDKNLTFRIVCLGFTYLNFCAKNGQNCKDDFWRENSNISNWNVTTNKKIFYLLSSMV